MGKKLLLQIQRSLHIAICRQISSQYWTKLESQDPPLAIGTEMSNLILAASRLEERANQTDEVRRQSNRRE